MYCIPTHGMNGYNWKGMADQLVILVTTDYIHLVVRQIEEVNFTNPSDSKSNPDQEQQTRDG